MQFSIRISLKNLNTNYEFHCSNLVNTDDFLIVRTKSYNNKNYFVVVVISTSITLLTTILKQE